MCYCTICKNIYTIRENATFCEICTDIWTKVKDVYIKEKCTFVIPLKRLNDFVIFPLGKVESNCLIESICKLGQVVIAFFFYPFLCPPAFIGMVMNPVLQCAISEACFCSPNCRKNAFKRRIYRVHKKVLDEVDKALKNKENSKLVEFFGPDIKERIKKDEWNLFQVNESKKFFEKTLTAMNTDRLLCQWEKEKKEGTVLRTSSFLCGIIEVKKSVWKYFFYAYQSKKEASKFVITLRYVAYNQKTLKEKSLFEEA